MCPPTHRSSPQLASSVPLITTPSEMPALSETLLLDANVLLALAWPSHQFHAAATKRLERGSQRWSTCALTQLSFIRLSSNPAVIPAAVTPAGAAALLAEMVRDPLHTYLERLPPPAASSSAFAEARGHQQTTDLYLLTVARRHRARFLTFDSRLRSFRDVELIS
jgi:uncharacterized protein